MALPDADTDRSPTYATRLSIAALARLPLYAVVVLLLLLIGPPLVSLAVSSFQVGAMTPRAEWSLSNYLTVLEDVMRGGPVLNSVIFALGSSFLALFLGGLLAFIVERTNTPLRALGYFIAIAVIAIPAAVYAIAWTLLLGRGGLINIGLAEFWGLFGWSFRPIRINSLAGMIFVEGLSFMPIAFLLLSGPIRSMDRSLEEAALTSGARPWQVLRRISAPLLLPSIIAVLLLTITRALEAYAVPSIIGMPGRVLVMTTEVYTSTQQLPPQYGLASSYGMVLVLLVVALLYLYTSVTAQSRRFATVTGKGFETSIIQLGWQRWIFFGILLLYLLITVILPLLILAWASVMRFYAGPTLTGLNFDQYKALLGYPIVIKAFTNSIFVSAIAATVIMAISVVVSWYTVRGAPHLRRWLDLLITFPLVFPGIVLGLALMQTYAQLPIGIYGTQAILIIAYVTRFIPWGYRYSHTGMLQIHPELEEAALLSRASRFQVGTMIIAPLIIIHLIAGWTFVFLISARELETSVLLVSSRSPVIAPLLMDIYSSGSIPQVSAFSTLIFLTFGSLAIAVYTIARRYGIQMR